MTVMHPLAMPEAEPLLELDGIVADLGTFRVEVEKLQLPRFGVTGLVGLNGAGKTAVCDIIDGALPIRRGRILFNGKNIAALDVSSRAAIRIARKYQDKRLSPQCDVLENMELAAPMRSKDGSAIEYSQARQRIDNGIQRTRLAEMQERLADDLSAGEQQRLALARLILRDPELLLVDEPTAGLGPGDTNETLQLLRELGTSCSILLIAHDMDFIRQVSSQVAVIDQGRLFICGSYDQIIQDDRVQRLYPTRPARLTSVEPAGEEPSECALTVTDLTVRYGGVRALSNVSMQFPSGTITGIFGRNGAGKTTLLDGIMGALEQTDGEIKLFDRSISKVGGAARARTGLAMVSQGDWNDLFPDSTLHENLRVCLDVHRSDKRPFLLRGQDRLGLRNPATPDTVTRGESPGALIESLFSMPQFDWMKRAKGKKIAVLSGGERIQVAIARAILARPRILLLDEPTFGVDERKRSQLLELFCSLARGQCALAPEPVTIVLVEQQAQLIRPYIDRYYVLDRGEVLQKGPRSQLTTQLITQLLGA